MKAFIRKDIAIADYGLPPSLMERLRTIGFGFEPPDFATEFAEHLEAILLEPYEFAGKAPKAPKAGGKKNCTPGKSHFCQKEGGAGTCLPVSKKCKYVPEGDGAAASGYVADKAPEVKANPDPTTLEKPKLSDNDEFIAKMNPEQKAQIDAYLANVPDDQKESTKEKIIDGLKAKAAAADDFINKLPPEQKAKVDAYLSNVPDDKKESTKQQIVDALKAQAQPKPEPKPEPKPKQLPIPQPGSKEMPEGVAVKAKDGYLIYSFDVAGKQVDVYFSHNSEKYASVNFEVAGEVDRGSLQGREATLAALKVSRVMQYDMATRPDGFKYETSAYAGDGYGDKRAAAYEKIGFSKPQDIGDPQYAILRQGKLVPISEDEFLED